MEHNDKQYIRMTETPVPRLVTGLAIPTVISMLITAFYNTADTFFVSKLGTSASGAVGIVFSLMAIIQAFGFTLGMGAGSLISRLLGRRNETAASRTASTAFFAAITIGLLISVSGLVFIDELMNLLGATDTILPYARNYARYILPGAPIMCASFVMNNVLRSEGKAAFSMIGLTTGGILNILLDPVFIFGLGMGTAGAAVATLISQTVSFLILFQFFLRRKSVTRISIRCISFRFAEIARIVKTGFPSLCRQGLASIATVLLNRSAAVFGDAAVAGMTIVLRLAMLAGSVMIGIGQGFTPVAGYNYGAKKYSRVRQSFWFTVKAGSCFLSIAALLVIIFAPPLMRLFCADDEVIAIGTRALRFQFCVLPLHAFIVAVNMLMQATGKIKSATFLACNRQGVFFIPAIMLLPRLFNLTGVEISQTCADAVSFLVAIPYLIVFMRRLPRNEKSENAASV